MLDLTQKVFQFRDAKDNKLSLANDSVYVKVGNKNFPVHQFFEKYTFSNSSIKGYSFFERGTLKDGKITFEGQEIEFKDKANNTIKLTEIHSPIIIMNDITDELEKRYKIFKTRLKFSPLLLLETDKNYSKLVKSGYKFIEFSNNEINYIFAYHTEDSAYLFKVENNINLVIDDKLNEIDTTKSTIEYESGFGFSFIYGKTKSNLTLI